MRNCRLNKNILKSRSRRRGQALLLSVLVMIFVVLLGTTFIAIVASNMSNTARTGSKDAARQAAKAGIAFADNQLTDSTDGLDWRPTFPATPGNFYYSSFDQAQGWGLNSSPYMLYGDSTSSENGPANFVKYPSPNGASPTGNTTNFMIRLSQVELGDSDNADNTKTGDTRIESIGFANDDPAAYYSIVAYKNGSASNPLTASMRSVTNWDFNSGTVPQGYLDVGPGLTTQGPTLQLSNATGYFDPDACPFYVTITTLGAMNNSDPPQMASMEVTKVVYQNGEPQLTIPTPFTVSISSPTAALLVQKAANLGSPLTINYDNANSTSVDYHISGANNLSGSSINTPGSVWVNGGLVWFGTNPTLSGIANFDGIKATNLVAPSAATSTNPASILKVSGLFTSSIISAPATPAASVYVSGTTSGGPVTPTDLPTSSTDTLTASQQQLISSGLVDDGFNRLQGSQNPTRQAQPFIPPDITAGGLGFGRYRLLTRYSTSTNSSYPQAAAYGYGLGIYINNPTDVEKVGSTPMTQANLKSLWYDTGTTNSYNRLGTPDSQTATDKSLEQQHLRGWVSPDQFLPRGAEVVLNDVSPPTITVTLDARTDNDSDTTNGFENLYSTSSSPNIAHLDQSKMLRDENGNILQGVYTHTYTWPIDGTLYAEGNIRIRGKVSTANSPASSLTVVSMNNIYIEGSLGAGNKKVLLLAKKNVTVNPTQVLNGTETITSLSAPVSSGTSITVNDSDGFQIGDCISINDSITRNIISISGNTLNLDGNALGSYTAGSIVHTVYDPTVDGTALPATVATRIENSSQAIVRRLHLDAATNVRLAFRHSAEYKKALTVQIDPSLNGNKQPGTRIESAELNNKAITDHTSPVITADKKYLQVDYTQTPIEADGTEDAKTSGTDTFANNLAATPYQTNTGSANDLTAADNISIGDMYKQMLDKYTDPHWDYGNATGSPPTVVGTSIQNNITHTVPTSYTSGNQWADIDNIDNTSDPTAYHSDNAQHPLFYFMASVGNRKNFNTGTDPYAPTTEPGSYPINQVVYPTPSTVFTMPMATSMWIMVNGVQATLQGNIWDTGIGDFYKVLQFGFAPLFVNKDNSGNPIVSNIQNLQGTNVYSAEDYADNEDTLTSDQYFYQPNGKENITADGYGGSTYAKQTKYDSDAKYTLDSRLIADPAMNAGTNAVVLEMDEADIAGHPLSYYFQNHYQIPYYRLSNLKLENETLDDTSHELTAMGTGTIFDINAYVYAQDGGWNVIPGTDFDTNVKNNDDLNRDGVISQGESVAAYCYNHYNYQIVFTGSIMENQTASVEDVTAWADKWATVKMTVPTATPTYDSSNPSTSNFGNILYYYDPTAARGTLSADPGFHEPVAPGLIYQG